MSAEGFQTAAPVRMTAGATYVIASPEFMLPIPAERLPDGITAIKATLTLTQRRDPHRHPRRRPA